MRLCALHRVRNLLHILFLSARRQPRKNDRACNQTREFDADRGKFKRAIYSQRVRPSTVLPFGFTPFFFVSSVKDEVSDHVSNIGSDQRRSFDFLLPAKCGSLASVCRNRQSSFPFRFCSARSSNFVFVSENMRNLPRVFSRAVERMPVSAG